MSSSKIKASAKRQWHTIALLLRDDCRRSAILPKSSLTNDTHGHCLDHSFHLKVLPRVPRDFFQKELGCFVHDLYIALQAARKETSLTCPRKNWSCQGNGCVLQWCYDNALRHSGWSNSEGWKWEVVLWWWGWNFWKAIKVLQRPWQSCKVQRLS